VDARQSDPRHATPGPGQDGLADRELLRSAPKRTDSDHQVSMVAALANALPNPTLQAIGTALEQMRERTPRGGIRWAPSSVKHLLDKAKAAGLVRERERAADKSAGA
jgi:hypothetical protein